MWNDKIDENVGNFFTMWFMRYRGQKHACAALKIVDQQNIKKSNQSKAKQSKAKQKSNVNVKRKDTNKYKK